MKKIVYLFLMLFLSVAIVSCSKVTLEKLTIEGPAVVDVLAGSNPQYTAVANPEKADNSVVWSVDQPDKAEISAEGVLTVKATTYSIIAVIATSKVDSTITATKSVTLSAPSIAIAGPQNVVVGEEISLTKTIVGTTESAVTWKSSDVAVATVSNTGVVTGVAQGSVVISVELTNHPAYKATYNVSVVGEIPTWFGNGAEADYYVITSEAGVNTVNYDLPAEKAWSYAYANVENNLNVERVSITLSSAVAGTVVMVKPGDVGALEKTITLTATPTTYHFAFDGKMTNPKLLVFPEPGNGAAKAGSFIVHSYTTSATKWVDGGDNVYTVTGNQIAWDKTVKAGTSWSYVSLPIAKWTDVKRVVLNITGTEGQKLMLKLRNQVEQQIILTAEAANYTVAVSSADLVIDNLLLIFANPGDATGSGQFTVNSVNTFTTLEPSPIPWIASADTIEVVDNLNGTYTVNYATPTEVWSNVKLPIPTDGSYDRAIVTLTSVAGVTNSVNVKIKDLVEKRQNLNATGDTVYDVSTTQAAEDGHSFLYIFPYDGQNVTGSFIISSVQWLTYTNGAWSGNNAEGVYTVETADGVTTVVADKGAYALPTGDSNYSPLSYGVDNNTAYKSLTLKLKGAVGGEIVLVKLRDGVEKSFTLTNDWAEYTVQTPNLATYYVDTRIIIFALPGNKTDSITFSIKDVELGATGSDLVWGSSSSVFTVVNNPDGTTTVTFNNPGAGYQIVQLPVDGQQNKTKVTLTLQGTAGTRILLKFHNDGGAGEKGIVLDGTEQVIVFEHTSANLDQFFRMFVVYGDVANNTVFEGSFTIISAVFE